MGDLAWVDGLGTSRAEGLSREAAVLLAKNGFGDRRREVWQRLAHHRATQRGCKSYGAAVADLQARQAAADAFQQHHNHHNHNHGHDDGGESSQSEGKEDSESGSEECAHAQFVQVCKAIDKDLDRTFGDGEGDDQLVRRLRDVLMAYCQTSGLGYTQGLNFITGSLLQVVDDESAFHLLQWLCECVLVNHHSPDMGGFQLDYRALGKLVEQRLPALCAHLREHGFMMPLVCTDWFISLFCNALAPTTRLVLWDAVFVLGMDALMSACLALFAATEQELLESTHPSAFVHTLQSKCASAGPELVATALESPWLVEGDEVDMARAVARIELDKDMRDLKAKRELYRLEKKTVFTLEHLQSLHDEFMALTRNKRRQVISPAEFSAVLGNVMGSKLDASMLFRAFDTNGDGDLDFSELIAGLSLLCHGSPTECMEFCFRAFDISHSGFIEKVEMLAMLEYLTSRCFEHAPDSASIQSTVACIFAHCDENGDGRLSFEEFCKVPSAYPPLLQCFVQTMHAGKTAPQPRANVEAQPSPGTRGTCGPKVDAEAVSLRRTPATNKRPQWAPQTASSVCSVCTRRFSFFRRVHHCRACGNLVCFACSLWRALPRLRYSSAVRVCAVCYVKETVQS